MASKGFQVEGIDISGKAIDTAKKLAHDNNVKINAHIVDLEKDTFIEKNRYDVIVCFNFLQRSLIPAIREGIRPGGVIVYETYIVDQARFGRPTNPEYLLKHNELLDLFKGFRCLRYHEGIYADKKAVAGIIAKKQQE
jgi:2-polyprenyl-3-methyl-5-hydroxy-6-metoxy-1,4-benzoquinol methylase